MRLVVENVFTWIDGFYPKGLLDPVTSYLKEGAWFSKAYRQGTWDGRIRFTRYNRQRRQYHFPTGFLSRVVAHLSKTGQDFFLDDHRDLDICDSPVYTLHDNTLGQIHLDREPHDYQGEALNAALTYGRGILHLATNAGKTAIGTAFIASVGQEAIWLTHLRGLLHQSRDSLAERLQQPVGIIGDSECQYEPVTVATVQTLANHKHDDFLKTRRVLVADEVHHATADQWYDALSMIPAPWRLGLSATPQLDGEGLALLAMTGDVIYRVTSLELIARGVSVPPRIWIVPVPEPTLDEKTDHRTVYSQGVVLNPWRNNFIAEVAERFRDEKKPSLTLVHRIKHGKHLVAKFKEHGVKADLIWSSVSHEDRQKMLAKLWAGKLHGVVAIASTMGEGVNLPKLRAIINATGTSGGGNAEEGETGRATIQILGRGLRKSDGKDHIDYVDFADMGHPSLRDASLSRLGTLKSEGYGSYVRYWKDYCGN